MGQRFARACTLSLSFLSQICFCGSRTALPLPQTGRGYKEREGHRERKRESALKKRGKRERVKLKRAPLGFVRSSGTKSTVRRKQKKKRTHSSSNSLVTEKPALNKRPPSNQFLFLSDAFFVSFSLSSADSSTRESRQREIAEENEVFVSNAALPSKRPWRRRGARRSLCCCSRWQAQGTLSALDGRGTVRNVLLDRVE